MTMVDMATNHPQLQPLKSVEVNAARTTTVRVSTGSLQDSAGWLDLGLLGVIVYLEYIVTPSTERAAQP